MAGNNAGAAKRPDNNNAIPDTQRRIPDNAPGVSRYGNGQAMPGRQIAEVHAGLSKCYFAAVGNGTGLSASVAK
jgi:hypothetical protein